MTRKNNSPLSKVDFAISSCLFFVGILSRAPLVEKIQSYWDGPQFSIAILHYSFTQQTPAPPGYPLYIALGKFFYLFLHNPHQALLAVSVLESAFGAVIFYLIGKNMYARAVGIVAALIFLTGSVFYYFSLTAYGYGLVPITTAILAYAAYLIFLKHKQIGFLLGLVFGISVGMRPQETIVIFPLFVLGFIFLSKREKAYSLLSFAIVTLIWVIPSVYVIGFKNYFMLSAQFALTAFPHVPISQHIELMIKGFLLSFGVSAGFLTYFVFKYWKGIRQVIEKNIRVILFYGIWIIPSFLFNLFVRSDHAGYQMSYLAAFLILISYTVWKTTEKSKVFFIFAVFIISIFNLYWFFYNRDPNYTKPYRITSFHYSDIRKNDLKTGSKVNFILKNFNPKTTLIITTDALWRPYMYYLKNYQLTDLSGLDNNSPDFKYGRIDAINWNMHQYENKSLSLVIPNSISTVVFTDDNTYSWVKNYPFKQYRLPGNSNLISISVVPREKIIYNFNRITVSKNF